MPIVREVFSRFLSSKSSSEQGNIEERELLRGQFRAVFAREGENFAKIAIEGKGLGGGSRRSISEGSKILLEVSLIGGGKILLEGEGEGLFARGGEFPLRARRFFRSSSKIIESHLEGVKNFFA